MNVHFFYVITITLITRLYLMKNTKTKQPLSIIEALFLSSIPVFFIIITYRLSIGSLCMIGGFFVIYCIQYFIEKIAYLKLTGTTGLPLTTNLARFLSFLALFIFAGIWSASQVNLMTRPFVCFLHPAAKSLSGLIAPFAQIGWNKVGAMFMGLLVVTNEVNIFFCFILDAFNISHPRNDKNTTEGDGNEYNTGRLIGILERILVYFLVLIGRYEAIGFIMAAKAFTRFKELDNREFAEYVLIGTLLSITLSVATALFIKQLILILP
jgi:hypothetical protein